MSEQPRSLQELTRNRLFWPGVIALALAVLFALVPGVPGSLEILADSGLLLLLVALATAERR